MKNQNINFKYLVYFIIFIIIGFLIYNYVVKLYSITQTINKVYVNGSPCAMITGGARGIGEAYANALLERGYKVVIVDKLNAKETADKFANKYGLSNIKGIYCDITDKKSYHNAFIEASNFANDGILDIIILNAGILTKLFYNTEELIQTNLLGPIYGTEMYVKQITNGLQTPSEKQGLIVITSSKAGIIPFDSDLSPIYNASKAGLNQFVRSMEPFATRFNFRINAICPSFVETEINAPFIKGPLDRIGLEVFLNTDGRGGIMKPNDLSHVLLRIIDDNSINCQLLAVSKSVGLQGQIVPYDPCGFLQSMGKWTESQSWIDHEVVNIRMREMNENIKLNKAHIWSEN